MPPSREPHPPRLGNRGMRPELPPATDRDHRSPYRLRPGDGRPPGRLGPGHRLAELRGRPLELDGRIVLVTYHPAAVFYREELKSALQEDMRHLAELLRGYHV